MNREKDIPGITQMNIQGAGLPFKLSSLSLMHMANFLKSLGFCIVGVDHDVLEMPSPRDGRE